MAETPPDLKLNRRQGKHWDLDSALAYIEGDQPSSRKGKNKVNKSVPSSPANNIGCPKAANITVTSKPVANAAQVKPANNTVPGGKLANVKEDIDKTWFKKEVEKLEIQLAAEASGHAKVASNFQNLKVEMTSLKESNVGLQEEVKSMKKLLLESQKKLEQTKTSLNKEQQQRRQSEANGKFELAAMASEEQKLQVQVQGLLKEQEKLQAALARETSQRLSAEQELKRVKVAAEEKKRAISNHMSSQSGKLESRMPTVVRQLVDQQLLPSLALCHSREQVDNRQQIDQYLREEQEQMENFRKLKQMETGKVRSSAHGLVDPRPHTPTLVKQTVISGQSKESYGQERLFGKNGNAIRASEITLSDAVASSQTPHLPNTSRSQQTSSAHARLVERLQERGNLLPVAPSECSLLVMKVFDRFFLSFPYYRILMLQLRTSRGGLSGLTMDQIEGEVRRLAKEDARSRERECPICFDLMLSDANLPGQLLRCVQCNQAFHSR